MIFNVIEAATVSVSVAGAVGSAWIAPTSRAVAVAVTVAVALPSPSHCSFLGFSPVVAGPSSGGLPTLAPAISPSSTAPTPALLVLLFGLLFGNIGPGVGPKQKEL